MLLLDKFLQINNKLRLCYVLNTSFKLLSVILPGYIKNVLTSHFLYAGAFIL